MQEKVIENVFLIDEYITIKKFGVSNLFVFLLGGKNGKDALH